MNRYTITRGTFTKPVKAANAISITELSKTTKYMRYL